MKKVIHVFLVLYAICILSVAALAAEYTMTISTDKVFLSDNEVEFIFVTFINALARIV